MKILRTTAGSHLPKLTQETVKWWGIECQVSARSSSDSITSYSAGWRGKLIGAKHSTRRSKRFIFVSKTSSRNPHECSSSAASPFLTKGNSNRTQNLTLTQAIPLRQCTPTPNKADVFGTGITLPGRADQNVVPGPCWPQLYAVFEDSGIKLSDPQRTSFQSNSAYTLFILRLTLPSAALYIPRRQLIKTT